MCIHAKQYGFYNGVQFHNFNKSLIIYSSVNDEISLSYINAAVFSFTVDLSLCQSTSFANSGPIVLPIQAPLSGIG